MKRRSKFVKTAILFFVLGSFTIVLTSCKVNLISKQVDAPWYFIAIPVALILIIAHIFIVRSHYKCPECGNVFRPKWYEISSWLHADGRRVVKCPKCGHRGYCKKV